MPLTTVVSVTSTQEKVPLCSCNWEGTRQPATKPGISAAWREANAHARDEHGETAGRKRDG